MLRCVTAELCAVVRVVLHTAVPPSSVVQIHMPNHESHVLPCTKDMVLEDLLPIISKKKKVSLSLSLSRLCIGWAHACMSLWHVVVCVVCEQQTKVMLPKAYKFLYLTENEASEGTLEMKTQLTDLKSDELRLVNKFIAGGGTAGAGAGAAAAEDDSKYYVVSNTASTDPDPSQFVFTAVCVAVEWAERREEAGSGGLL